MLPLPLLHASSTAQAAMSGAPGLRAYALVFLGALAAGALLGAASGMRKARRRQAIIVLAFALALLAVLPSVLPYDHLLASDAHAEAEASLHAGHCHTAPSTCADVPLTSGPGQFLDATPMLAAPAMLSILLLAAVPMLIGVSVLPDLRPPLSVLGSII